MPSRTTPGGRLYGLAEAYRDDLEAQSQRAVDRLIRSWAAAQARTEIEVSTFLKKLQAAREAGVEPSLAWLYQEERLGNVLRSIQRETRIWAPSASDDVRALAYDAQDRAEEAAQRLTVEAAAEGLPGLEVTFSDINPENLATVTAHLAPGGPLQELLAMAGTQAAELAQDALVQGVALGKGSDWITSRLRRALDVPRWRAETIARSEALRVFRETSRETYRASQVVGTWTWLAFIDRRTCVCCVVMDGTEHPVTETLDGHPRCRCTMIPRTLSWAQINPALADLPDTRPPVRSGKDWLAQAGESTQRALMGPGKLQAWKSGEVSLDDMVARTHSEAWGSMRRERSLVEIRQGRNANTLPDLSG